MIYLHLINGCSYLWRYVKITLDEQTNTLKQIIINCLYEYYTPYDWKYFGSFRAQRV